MRREQSEVAKLKWKNYSHFLLELSLLLSSCFLACANWRKQVAWQGADTLTIYNWGDYIDPALIKKFERETGYKVNYETFDSNDIGVEIAAGAFVAPVIFFPQKYLERVY